ncbi:MAG: betaine/proline/choline family ABC transporter ATP-binding protein [Gammaproteobacteria bacterium]|nr:betaine/proline/choline family ABC transporter ATP-binding protein [Gammaproteobacteria bacterium]
MNSQIPDQQNTQNKIKLSCHNVWKIYGQEIQDFFGGEKDKFANPLEKADARRAAGNIVANADVSFDVHVGERFVIMGLSGSGKSTIVRCLSRLVEPTAGQVILDGEDLLKKTEAQLIDIRRHQMGMVFQSFGLMPHLNVIDNIAFPLKLQGIKESERYSQAKRVIELVGLEGRESNYPKQLSGGQQQRVGIARSLAVEPEVWLLDEPFSALDPLIRKQMQDEFLRIQSLLHKSIVFITHDFHEALRLADRMAIMRDGAVVQIGRPVDLILNPADDYVREFTTDVPWESILRAADIAEAPVGSIEGMRRVAGETLIDELLGYLAEHHDGLVVEGSAGEILGVATARGVLNALASGSKNPLAATEL